MGLHKQKEYMNLEEMVVVGIGEDLEGREWRMDLTKTHYMHTWNSQPTRKKKESSVSKVCL